MLGYLFYSKKCTFCRDLMKIMENQNMINMFVLKCVDDMTSTDFTKLGLRFVPTLVLINNNNGQQSKGIYEKTEAFKWVNNVIENRRDNMIKFAENNRRLIEVNEMKKRIADGLTENCQNEMDGISDSYAYWKNDLSQDIDMAQPKSFVSAANVGNPLYGIETVPDDKSIKKLSKKEQEKMIDFLANKRNDDDINMKSFMKQQQINKVFSPTNPPM